MHELVQEFISLISQVGFPIACCIFMMYQNTKKDEQRAKQNAEIQSKHDEQLTELRKVITDNTLATNNLVTLITHFLNKGDA